MKRFLFFVLGFGFALAPVMAQTYTSVPVDAPIYRILDKAQMRGLCKSLSGARPYSRAVILKALDEIIASDSDFLSAPERRIIQEAQIEYRNKEIDGFDARTLTFSVGHESGTNIPIYGEIDFDLDLSGSLALPLEGETQAWSGELRPKVTANGDIGTNFSFGIDLEGAVMRAPRKDLGYSYPFYDGFPEGGYDPEDTPIDNTDYPIYSEPLAYFPYTYRKRWDVWLSPINNISSGGATAWPDGITLGYTALAEMSGTLLHDVISYRFGRVDREWGAMDPGASLILNQQAQPFLALEATASLSNWFRFSTLTGILEFSPERGGLQEASATFQNAFSASMIEVDYKQFFHFDFGATTVWPKRFEIGYLFPLFNAYLYQNNIGDNDNLALFASIRGQYPGLGKIWFSGFADELDPKEIFDLFSQDRMMFALQGGISVNIPWLPFATASLRYTKIEPYTYTHQRRNDLPWYGDNYMETNYVNNGRGLGYYLPPNSDELLFRFETQPTLSREIHLQYQMIRHGADYGSHAVDGSSYWSELDPWGRSDKQVLRKSFLRDGAYQWQHIIKIGAENKFVQAKLPFQIYGEMGVVISYFTDIEGVAAGTPYTDWGGKSYSTSIVNTSEYPKSTTFIAILGARLFL